MGSYLKIAVKSIAVVFLSSIAQAEYKQINSCEPEMVKNMILDPYGETFEIVNSRTLGSKAEIRYNNLKNASENVITDPFDNVIGVRRDAVLKMQLHADRYGHPWSYKLFTVCFKSRSIECRDYCRIEDTAEFPGD